MTVQRVALVLLVDVHGGGILDPQDWAEAAVRRALGGERLALPAELPLPEQYREKDCQVVAVDVMGVLAATQSGALRVVARQPDGRAGA